MTTKTILLSFIGIAVALGGCAFSSPIQPYAKSHSAFSHPPELITHDFPPKDMYRIYHRAGTGFVSIQSTRKDAEQRAGDFAQRQGKSIVILGEQLSQPPYILGNFPRIEIVFALVDKPKDAKPLVPERDRYADLEKLKKLLDDGTLTQDEFAKEKAKILQ